MVVNPVTELTEGFEQPFGALGRDGAQDRSAVVISWPSVPVELIRAAGFRPVFARGSGSPTPAAAAVLEPDLFPARLRQLVEAALTGRLAQVAAIVLPRTSDPDYKSFLYLRELVRRGKTPPLPPVLLFDLLQSTGPEVRDHDVARARALLEQLGDIAGTVPDTSALRREIASANRARAAARRLQNLRRGEPRLTGVEAMPLLGAFWQLDPERYAALADAAAAGFAARAPLARPRVLLAGAPVDTIALHAAVEGAGATVVAEMSPFGSGAAGADVSMLEEPVVALADHYRSDSLDSRTPVATLMSRIESALAGIDAVVVALPADDASFGWDLPRLRALCEGLAVPHAVVTGDPTQAATATDRERIAALVAGVARVAGRREARHG